MKTYKYILFLLSFGLLSLQQVNAKSIGKAFQTGNTSKTCDIYYKISATEEVFVELKNVDFSNINDLSVLNTGTTSMQRINQVIGEKGAFSRITNLNQYEWLTTSLKNNDLNHLKQLWKKAFIDNAEDMFKTVDQGGLGIDKIRQLFGSNINDISDFLDVIDDINSPIYNFIKIE